MKLVFVLLFSFILIDGTYSQRIYKMADYEGFDNETEWFVRSPFIGEVLYSSIKSDSDMFRSYVMSSPNSCLLYTSPSPRDRTRSRMPSSA